MKRIINVQAMFTSILCKCNKLTLLKRQRLNMIDSSCLD